MGNKVCSLAMVIDLGWIWELSVAKTGCVGDGMLKCVW
jgi:hypothetical protein